MKIINSKGKLQKSRLIFCWLPSLMTIRYPEGEALILAWGTGLLVLRDKEKIVCKEAKPK